MKFTCLRILVVALVACGSDAYEVASKDSAVDSTPDTGETPDTGGGSPGSAPSPALDFSSSFLDTEARSFLASAGMANASTIGATQWVNGCFVSAKQGAFTSGSVTNDCNWANTRPGWIIVEATCEVLENKNDRGSLSCNVMNGPTTVSVTELDKFNWAIEAAATVGRTTAEINLKSEYDRLKSYSSSYTGAGNGIVARVTANGGFFEGSSIAVQTRAKLLRVQ